ncbi:MAG: VWA domain-containing protein, partial [Methyloceanibacter sp.]
MAAQSKTPAKKKSGTVEAPRSSGAEVETFLTRVKSMTPAVAGRGRLIFAMDATMSRQPTWDLALELQAEMFRAVKEVGGLDVQLV